MKKIFHYITSLWNKLLTLLKKKKMDNLLDPTTFKFILECLNKGGRLQIQKKNSTTWYSVKTLDISQTPPYFVIENGGSVELVYLKDVETFKCSK